MSSYRSHDLCKWIFHISVSSLCIWAAGAVSLSSCIHEQRFFRRCCSECRCLHVFTVPCVCVCFALVCAGVCVRGFCGMVLYLRGNTRWLQPIQTRRWINKPAAGRALMMADKWWTERSFYLCVIVQMCAQKNTIVLISSSAGSALPTELFQEDFYILFFYLFIFFKFCT